MKKNSIAIDCSGGIAGDMFSAALINAGADFIKMKNRMTFAGNQLGKTLLKHIILEDGSSRLLISIKNNNEILTGFDAEKILKKTFIEFNIDKEYRIFGEKILRTLLDAEKEAHSAKIFKFKNTGYLIPEVNSHDNNMNTHLHEAQDIVIDIIGVVSGLELLNIKPEGILLSQISVGSGKINFSHGTLNVPAPATKIILEKSGLKWEKGPIEKELCTPTGAAILYSLKLSEQTDLKIPNHTVKGISRGSKTFPIDPLKIYIY